MRDNKHIVLVPLKAQMQPSLPYVGVTVLLLPVR